LSTEGGSLRTCAVQPSGCWASLDVDEGLLFARSVSVHPSGRFVYVSGRVEPRRTVIRSFRLDAARGTLDPGSGALDFRGRAYGPTLEPDSLAWLPSLSTLYFYSVDLGHDPVSGLRVARTADDGSLSAVDQAASDWGHLEVDRPAASSGSRRARATRASRCSTCT
jgi:hypothetical protein